MPKGFSLLEVLILITIIAICSALVIPSIRLFDKSYVRMELDNVYELCISLQQRAQMTGIKQELILTANGYNTPDGHFHTFPKTIKWGTKPMAMAPPSEKEAIAKKSITFKQNTITFYPDGVISPGSAYLIDANGRYLYALTVSVSPISYIRRYYHDSTWQSI